ncbi:DUF5916 domain-containing protein [Fibrella aquatica]|uniref:DUF5916 domain-containing protein n=1 Tax=Fibrella aquatica TaxID=3242487 RepID=UPI0035205898
MLLRLHIIALFYLFFTLAAHGQTLPVAPTDSTIRVDGLLTEGVWQRASVAGQFIQNFPNDTAVAYNPTEVRVSFDATHLYVAVVCFDKDPAKRAIASSLKRDFEWDENDNFTVYLDPFGDRINGFTFNVTPYGVEREGQMFNGERVASQWDNKWRSVVKKFPDRWQAELAIPFKSIRYRKGTTWFLMNFARHDLKNNQRTSWRRVPVAYSISALSFADTVRFSRPLPDPGPNISVIPYVSGRYCDDLGEPGLDNKGQRTFAGGIGFDAKIGITPSLNLDLTVNPDFSNVEADQQVTNLSRFEIFYPERRQFFIENQDLFANYGFESNRPFFSRRIGISLDTTTGVIVQNPLLYGARLSGKIDKNWRIGLLNTQTANQPGRGITGQNYTMGVVQRQVFGRSTVSAIFVNRQSVGGSPSGTLPDSPGFTRLGGLEYNLQTANNRWSGKAFYNQVFRPISLNMAGEPEGGTTNRRGNDTHGLNLNYTIRNLTASWTHEYVGRNYTINDIGYVQRRGYWRMVPEVQMTFYVPGNKQIISHGPFSDVTFIRTLDGRLTDREFNVGYNVQARNTTEGGMGFYRHYTYLFNGFDPTNSDGLELASGTDYTIQGLFGYLNTDKRNLLTASLEGWSGGYFNGKNTSLTAQIQYRFQPYGSVSMYGEYNNIRLPKPYKSAEYLLIGPSLDLTFSRKLFWTTTVQVNNQTANTLLNTRLQWRYAPVSDLFVVYQENYFPGSLTSKNRALVVKLSYWFNV